SGVSKTMGTSGHTARSPLSANITFSNSIFIFQQWQTENGRCTIFVSLRQLFFLFFCYNNFVMTVANTMAACIWLFREGSPPPKKPSITTHQAQKESFLKFVNEFKSWMENNL